MLLQFRTPADLRVPTDAQLAQIPREQWSAAQQQLLATLRAFIGRADGSNTGKATQQQKLHLLGLAVLPLAQTMICLGVPFAIAVEHATELLESNFLLDALDDTSGLATWFAQ